MSKVSIVISVYQSHEIVRRQLLHLSKLLTPDVELILVDDGSDPPIEGAAIRTGNKAAWTQGLARNEGARVAKGEYIFFTDIDHILSKESIEDALNFSGNKMIFRRQIAVLDEEGNIRQDRETLDDWGWTGKKDASVHGNTYVIRNNIFWELGGYDKGIVGYHPKSRGGEDVYFNAKWNQKYTKNDLSVGRDIYLFPTGRFNKDGNLNPKGLFHDLSQEIQTPFEKYGRTVNNHTGEK